MQDLGRVRCRVARRAGPGRALARPETGIAVNPTSDLEMPAVSGGRDRIASPDECADLLAALRPAERALWATAMYAGLRRGELMALRREDVDLAAGVIHVRRGWDAVEGEIATKSGKDRRVPIPAILRGYLDDQLQALAWTDGLVFGVAADRPFNDTTMREHTRKAWGWQLDDQGELVPSGSREPPLEPITLHECRHTFASLMIAAGVNAKALSTYMGYGHQLLEARYSLAANENHEGSRHLVRWLVPPHFSSCWGHGRQGVSPASRSSSARSRVIWAVVLSVVASRSPHPSTFAPCRLMTTIRSVSPASCSESSSTSLCRRSLVVMAQIVMAPPVEPVEPT